MFEKDLIGAAKPGCVIIWAHCMGHVFECYLLAVRKYSKLARAILKNFKKDVIPM